MTRFLTLTAAAALFATSAAAQAVFQGDERDSRGMSGMSGDVQYNEGTSADIRTDADLEAGQPGLEDDDDDFAFNTDACSRPHYINLDECKNMSEGRASAQSDVSDPQEGTVGSSQSPGNDSGGNAGAGGGGGPGGE